MKGWRRAQGRVAPVFLLPAGLILALFSLWPTLRVLDWSLTNADLLRTAGSRWSGFSNYAALVSDPRFLRAFENTALFALMVVPIQTVLALFLALWVDRPERPWRMLRSAFFVPTIVSMPVLAMLWTLLYQPAQGGSLGPVNAALRLLGLAPRAWLGDPRLALPAIAFMSIWQGVGLQMMILLAGLQGVSGELLEAARLDGAGPVRRLIHVILPALRNSLGFAVTVTTILAFRIFVQPYLMTRGGPGDSTLSLVQAIYDTTFLDQDLGLASAASVLFVLWVALLALGLRRLAGEERA